MRNRVKNDAQANEQFFRSIFENAQICISFFSIEGRPVFCGTLITARSVCD